MHVPQIDWSKFADLFSKLGGVLTGMVALWGALKYLPRIIDTAKLSKELTVALESAREASSAARSYRLAAEAYRERIDSMIEEMKEATERANAASERADTALVYIVDLINFAKSGRPFSEMPRLPESLEADVYHIIWKRAQALKSEAPKVESPFPGVPEEGKA